VHRLFACPVTSNPLLGNLFLTLEPNSSVLFRQLIVEINALKSLGNLQFAPHLIPRCGAICSLGVPCQLVHGARGQPFPVCGLSIIM
jgi:hypothetical protein